MLLNNKYLIPAFSRQYDPPTLVKVNYNSDQSCIVKKPTTQVKPDTRLIYKSNK
ncbi:MAG: hypothetical protein H6Q24_1084 [Bacteroidetes bacterium]|nr:hypothetical protein [Bacteroidota bacterium]